MTLIEFIIFLFIVVIPVIAMHYHKKDIYFTVFAFVISFLAYLKIIGVW